MTALSAQQKEALVKLLIEGLKKGDHDMVRGCMERGCDPLATAQECGSGGYRAGIHWAVVYFHEKCADLVFAGSGVNVRDSAGETPLFTAIRETKPDAVEYLMKKGADPVAQNKNGNVASDLAIGLPRNTNYNIDLRARIIKALTGPVVKDAAGPAAEFNAASTTDVKVMKPLVLQKSDAEHAGDDRAPDPGKGPGFKL